MNEGYGVGLTGHPGIGPLGWGSTLLRHAVAASQWLPDTVTADAVCSAVVTLDWVWGQPLAFSAKDSDVCPQCLAAIGRGSR